MFKYICFLLFTHIFVVFLSSGLIAAEKEYNPTALEWKTGHLSVRPSSDSFSLHRSGHSEYAVFYEGKEVNIERALSGYQFPFLNGHPQIVKLYITSDFYTNISSIKIPSYKVSLYYKFAQQNASGKLETTLTEKINSLKNILSDNKGLLTPCNGIYKETLHHELCFERDFDKDELLAFKTFLTQMALSLEFPSTLKEHLENIFS